MDTGTRKAHIVAVSAAALIAAGEYNLATGIVALYMVVNTILHFVGKDGIDDSGEDTD